MAACAVAENSEDDHAHVGSVRHSSFSLGPSIGWCKMDSVLRLRRRGNAMRGIANGKLSGTSTGLSRWNAYCFLTYV